MEAQVLSGSLKVRPVVEIAIFDGVIAEARQPALASGRTGGEAAIFTSRLVEELLRLEPAEMDNRCIAVELLVGFRAVLFRKLVYRLRVELVVGALASFPVSCSTRPRS